MEYANFGFSSNDGQRSWQADRRPGQSTPTAEWRQDDPGMTPVGDVYGGGSPTGNVFYENGALGAAFEGTFLAAEAGRNEIFSYQPRRQGAGFALDRNIFMTSNVKQEYAGSDFIGGNATAKGVIETLFRPSDIAVAPSKNDAVPSFSQLGEDPPRSRIVMNWWLASWKSVRSITSSVPESERVS